MNGLERIISLLAPHICIGCGREGAVLCPDCRQRLPAPVARCYRCYKVDARGRTCRACRSSSALRSVQTLTRYEGAAKDMVWRMKFGRAQAAADEAGAMLADAFSGQLFSGSIVAPVPTATGRIRQRGYDQAALIARQFSRASGLPRLNPLRRRGQQQQHGAARAQRLRQLKGAFEVSQHHVIMGKRILLIDDVLTTGATLQAAAAALKAAGAKSVDALAFAQA